MLLEEVHWTPLVNWAQVLCDCGKRFWWPTNISLCRCECGRAEYWCGFEPRAAGDWKVMENRWHPDTATADWRS